MFTLACKDVNPTTSCMFKATSETKKEVIDNFMKHANTAPEHTEEMKMMTNEDKNQMMARIEETLSGQM